MDINRASVLKDGLEIEIRSLIIDFEDSTGLKVSEITLTDTTETLGGEEVIITSNNVIAKVLLT